MGAIERVVDGERVPLGARLRIGRAGDADLRVTHASVSRDHALVAWTGTFWEARDLGSQNGTFVDGARLLPGGRSELAQGGVCACGSVQVLRLVDASPPQPLARDADGRWIEGRGGVLELRGEAADGGDDVFLWADGTGEWVAEATSERRPVRDGDTFAHAGRPWTLHLPAADLLNPTVGQPNGQRAPLRLHAGMFQPRERVMVRDGAQVPLSPTEARLLVYLADRAGEPVSQRELLASVWGYRDTVESRTVYVTVNRLRRKIEVDPTRPRHLRSVAGLGYRFVPVDGA